MSASVTVTTTSTIEGKPVQEHCGVVAGEVIIGANSFRDFLASIRDAVGGRSDSYEELFGEARDEAIAELQTKAAARGGNAVLGISLDYEVIGEKGSILMVCATGTAVRV